MPQFSDLEFKPRKDGDFDSGVQAQIEFPNGYGASVIRGRFSYGGDQGLYELAVLNAHGDLTYDTPVTDDVEGYCSEQRITELLQQIAALPKSEA